MGEYIRTFTSRDGGKFVGSLLEFESFEPIAYMEGANLFFGTYQPPAGLLVEGIFKITFVPFTWQISQIIQQSETSVEITKKLADRATNIRKAQVKNRHQHSKTRPTHRGSK